MPWPFNKSIPMPNATRGGGDLNVNGGGGVVQPKPMPYSPPKTTEGRRVNTDPKYTNHGCCGTQGKH
jgi:hypothetical protein